MIVAAVTQKPITLAAVADSPYHSPEVGEWVAAAQAGDQVAFTKLMELFQRDVYGRAFSILRNHQDADDVVQETFLRVYRALPGFRGESSFRTWLITVATRQAINYINRSRQCHEDIDNEVISATSAALRVEDNQMSALLDQEARALMRRAFPRLPQRQKEALALRMHHDMKYDEIAQRMGTTVGSVKAHIFHAIKNLSRRVKGGKP